MQLMSRTAALRLTARRFRVFRSVNQYWARDLGSTAQDVSVPDYWRARSIAMRWRAEEVLRLMGMDVDNAGAAVDWAIGRGCSSVSDIVALAAQEL